MPEPVRVSYLITTRNRASFLVKALSNVREFITPADELIIVDGNSTDNTRDIVEAHRDIVKVFVSEPDRGEAHGYNKGLMLARGKYIKFITDDDYLYPDAMRRAIAVLEEGDSIEALQCGGAFHRMIDGQFREVWYSSLDAVHASDQYLVSDGWACGIGLFIRRDILPYVGLLDCQYFAVDIEYMDRILALGIRYKYCHIRLFDHYLHAHSGTNKIAKSNEDCVRAGMRIGSWEKLFRYGLDPLYSILCLDKVRGGWSFICLIWFLEKWRRGRASFLLFALVRAARAVGNLSRKVVGLAVQLFHAKGACLGEPSGIPVEPAWDGQIVNVGAPLRK